MKIPITYAEAKARHPQLVRSAVKALRASSSLHKAEAGSKLDWNYHIAVRIEGYTIDQIRSGDARRRSEADHKLSVEERVQDQLKRSGATLEASMGRWHHICPLDTTPPEWETHTRNEYERIQQERDAYEALPESEKELRLQEALKAASRFGGFAVLTVPELPKKKA